MFPSVLNCFVVAKQRTDLRSKKEGLKETGVFREQFDELPRLRTNSLLLAAGTECFSCAVFGNVKICDSERSW